MALPKRTSVFLFSLIKNPVHCQTVTQNVRTSLQSLARRTGFSTTCARQNTFPPNFYHRKEAVDEDSPRTGFIESKEDFKYVERLIPPLEPPGPPVHETYPTPSGWSPPKGTDPGTPYSVRRTRYHSVPVYLKLKFGDSQQLTIVKNIEGDVWALAEELKVYLEELAGYSLPMRVHEVGGRVHFKGMFKDEVKKWLLEKGF
ncbi:39S ribosomal protein L49, mitochondrial-like [Acanthaster planci]|uniref:Large ribosomal subunit protein mL49 n=1 Tax=Acanthaster planci TaxID=133434 RepID=A0A8B7YQF5_ACAPL|nr:39S ribosomal protein L49, mitochondrial-like [Acanthaster planci]